MLWYLLYAVLGLIALFVLAFVALIINLRLASARAQKALEAALAPVREALAANRAPDPSTLQQLAADPMTRSGLFMLLEDQDALKHFPQELAQRESLAESDLVFWLAHPNELKGPPDEIELVAKQSLDSGTGAGTVRWYLFKFRTHPPHWAADKGWMVGVGGPYPEDYVGSIRVPLIRSKFNRLEDAPAEAHIQFFHELAREGGVFEVLAQLRAAEVG